MIDGRIAIGLINFFKIPNFYFFFLNSIIPAASFIRYFKGKYLVIINMGQTSNDDYADIVIRDKVGKILIKLSI